MTMRPSTAPAFHSFWHFGSRGGSQLLLLSRWTSSTAKFQSSVSFFTSTIARRFVFFAVLPQQRQLFPFQKRTEVCSRGAKCQGRLAVLAQVLCQAAKQTQPSTHLTKHSAAAGAPATIGVHRSGDIQRTDVPQRHPPPIRPRHLHRSPPS